MGQLCCTTVGRGIARQTTAAGRVSSRNRAKGNKATSDTTVCSSRNRNAPNTSAATGGRTEMIRISLLSTTSWLISSRLTCANRAARALDDSSLRGDKKSSKSSGVGSAVHKPSTTAQAILPTPINPIRMLFFFAPNIATNAGPSLEPDNRALHYPLQLPLVGKTTTAGDIAHRDTGGVAETGRQLQP